MELGDRFPPISERINAEMDMIRDEISLRAAGKHKPSPSISEYEPEYEGFDVDSMADMANCMVMEDECEI